MIDETRSKQTEATGTNAQETIDTLNSIKKLRWIQIPKRIRNQFQERGGLKRGTGSRLSKPHLQGQRCVQTKTKGKGGGGRERVRRRGDWASVSLLYPTANDITLQRLLVGVEKTTRGEEGNRSNADSMRTCI